MPRMEDTLRRCVSGALPPPMALMELLVHANAPADVDRTLATAEHDPRLSTAAVQRVSAIKRMWERHPRAWSIVRSVLGAVLHDKPFDTTNSALAQLRAAFDTAATISPEASVALYSLGDPDLLSAATAEVAARLREWRFVAPGLRMVDFGCGIGRFEQALHDDLGMIVGVDIAPAMLRVAAERCRGLADVSFVLGSGCDLAFLRERSIDRVLAMDSFPYLVAAGGEVVEAVMGEIARVLKPGGRLLIANFSYRQHVDCDREDVDRLAAGCGFTVCRNGEGAFSSWDGLVFELVRCRDSVAAAGTK